MRFFATFLTALRALRRNKMRSLLTALGIIIGVGAVIAMVSIGNGAKAQVESQVASLGENLIMVWSGNVRRAGMSSGAGGGALTVQDAEALERELDSVSGVSPEARKSFRVAAGSENWFTSIAGVSQSYFDIRSWPFEEGEGFGERDVRASAKVAVLGATVAKELFGEESPVGAIVRIKGVPFIITGVLTRKGASMMGGNDQDDVIFTPYTSAMKRLMGSNNLRSIQVQARDKDDIPQIQSLMTDLLNQRHGIAADQESDFMVRSQEDIAQMATATSKVMTMLLAAIASVSLVVGGIGIMNIMLVSVTERTREIGIRMAVGAHGKDIMLQFLVEAIALSSLGGGFGILLGVGSTKLVSATMGWNVVISTTAIVLAFSVSSFIGVFFGFYPARKAAALDPIDALRYE